MLRNLLAIAILLTFTGQVLAVGFSMCSMHQVSQSAKDPKDHNAENMKTMNHSQHSDHFQHSSSSNASESNSAPNCCDDELSCDMSGCVIVVLSYDVDVQLVFHPTQKISSNSNLSLNSTPVNLFRPPILS